MLNYQRKFRFDMDRLEIEEGESDNESCSSYNSTSTKYILVTGGVISGIGKGVIASSIGSILKCCGLNVTSIKIDPYINIDAGTFSPFEHGEVYVLDDGGEVDLDLGNYERFLDVTLHSNNNITTGKIYNDVIRRERRGDYLGKTVQVVPHITDTIQEWVIVEAKRPVTPDEAVPQVCIIELGGTIGDIEGMPFVEAFRQFQFKVGRENFLSVHVSLVPEPKSTKEQKTKPTQASVRELRGLGISPDLIICRSENPINVSVKEKISNFCNVGPERVICIHDCTSIYRVPLLLEAQGVVNAFREGLRLPIANPVPRNLMSRFRELAETTESLEIPVTIALVGKYTQLEDSYASVTKALKHAAYYAQRKLVVKYVDAEDLEELMKELDPQKYHSSWKELTRADGVLVPGGFGKRGVEGKIAAAHYCRTKNKPYLGICLGLQAAVIEFSRNVLGSPTANSTEIDPDTDSPIVIEMPEHHTGQMGGTMRLGKRTTVFEETKPRSKLRCLYGDKKRIEERHRHRYEVNPSFVEQLQAGGLLVVAKDESGERMEAVEISANDYFVAVQFHPEYLSRPFRPSPPYLGLVLAAIGTLHTYLSDLVAGNARLPTESVYGANPRNQN